MSWLQRLLGLSGTPDDGDAPAGKPAEHASATPVGGDRVSVRRYGGHVFAIRQLDFTGQMAESPNQRFKLLWQDRMSVNGRLRDGRYILLDDGRVALDRRMARPQDGKVADDGTFILSDWEASDTLSGTLHAFAADGRPLLSRRFAANLLNNGLSADGRLAVCQTCNAPGSPDSSVLSVLDLAERREVACWSPESGWADGYEFPGGGRIRMIRREGVPLDYGLDGEFIDRREWYADEVARGRPFVIRSALNAGEEVTGLGLDALREGAKAAVTDTDERWRADSLRLLGEIEERAGDERAALDAFRRALEINPRVGVARRAAALAKRLGS